MATSMPPAPTICLGCCCGACRWRQVAMLPAASVDDQPAWQQQRPDSGGVTTRVAHTGEDGCKCLSPGICVCMCTCNSCFSPSVDAVCHNCCSCWTVGWVLLPGCCCHSLAVLYVSCHVSTHALQLHEILDQHGRHGHAVWLPGSIKAVLRSAASQGHIPV